VVGLSALTVFLYEYFRAHREIMSGTAVPLENISKPEYILMIIRYALGGIFYILAVTVGLIFLVFPGIYLAIVLFFWDLEVIRGKGVFHSFKKSFNLVEGYKLKILGFSFTAGAISAVIQAPFTAISMGLGITGVPLIGSLISVLGSVVGILFSITMFVIGFKNLLTVNGEIRQEKSQ